MKKFVIIFAAIVVCTGLSPVFAQTTIVGNASNTSTDYLGWKSTVQFPLNINHKGPNPIIFSTENIERMRLKPNGQLWLGIPSAITTNIGVANIYGLQSGQPLNMAVRVSTNGNIYRTSEFHAMGASANNVGVRGNCDGADHVNYGLYGRTCGNSSTSRNFAIYGSTLEPCFGADVWAGYFVGKAFTPGGVWNPSDAALKLNIEPLVGGDAMVGALNPKQYRFKDEYAHIMLPTGLQYGLLAQELQTVVPQAVTTVVNPAEYDDEDNLIHEAVEFQGVNYQQLIPVLIAAFQERQALLDAQTTEITEIEERLAVAEAKAALRSAE